MTRVMKGSAAKAGTPKLVCTGAKTGAGCDYVAIPLDAVEDCIRLGFRTLANGGTSGQLWAEGVEQALVENRAKVERIESRITDLIAGDAEMSQRQMWSLVKQLSDEKDELVEEQGNLVDLARDMAAPSVKRNLDALGIALAGEGDRTAANVALRQLFDKVAVDAGAGTLAFRWKTGESTMLRFTVPNASDRQSMNARAAIRDGAGRFVGS